MIDYKKLMKKCITLAKKGRGKVSPNPMVGCVVLDKNNEILSIGYHHKYGENHAERDALLKLKNGEEKDGTLIVNLEPCSHYGKTPPCADLIIERGIKKVVIGCLDNNPKVNGKGIEKLKSAGIEVVAGVLEDECRCLNEVFFKNIEQNKIFVALKTATTIDGKISSSSGDSKWITSQKSRSYGKKLRGYYDAILTSSDTVIADNPEMKHKNVVLLDKDLRTDLKCKIYKNNRIIIFTNKNITNEELRKNIEIRNVKIKDEKIDLNDVLEQLYNMGIKSVFVEAGGKLSGSFIKENLVDKVYYFMAPKILNDNSGKSCFNGDVIEKISEAKKYRLENVKKFEDDILIIYNSVK